MKQSILILFILLSVFVTAAQNAAETQPTDTIEGKTLGEVELVMQTVRHEADRDIFTVTKAMREGVTNAGQLLGRVQGVIYNRATGEISYMGSQNIKILVDSVAKDENYIKRLNPNRFSRIDIIHNPAGEYQSYNVLINLVTKKNFIGYDLSIGELVKILPSDYNGKGQQLRSWGNNAQFTYTFNRWSFYVDATFDRNRGGGSYYNSTTYPLNGISEASFENPRNRPQTFSKSENMNFNGGVEFRINSTHVIGANFRIDPSRFRTTAETRISFINENNPDPRPMIIDHLSITRQKPIHQYQATLFFQGKTGRWRYNANALYYGSRQKWFNTTRRSSGFDNTDNKTANNYFVFGSASAGYTTADSKFDFSLFTSDIWQSYEDTRMETGARLAKSTMNTNLTEAWAKWYISPSWTISGNIGLNTLSLNTAVQNSTTFQPRFCLFGFHSFSPQTWVRASYMLQASSPQSNYTLDYGQFTDSLIWSGGNPALKTNTSHTFNLSAGFFNKLTLEASYIINPDNITKYYSAANGLRPDGLVGPYAIETYRNTYLSNWDVRLTYLQPVKDFLIYAFANVNGAAAGINGPDCSAVGFGADLGAQYTLRSNNIFVVQYSGNRTVTMTPQSRQRSDTDILYIGYVRMFWNNRITATLCYYTPLHILSGKETTHLTSPALERTAWSNNQFRIDNTIMLNVTLNLSNGQVKKTGLPSMRY